ncbi:MAG TPA: cupin domain-containing protein [Dehalococcoidia bacterium]|nr:cupin domain-containing protein [Dehalococcoidia bacterium]
MKVIHICDVAAQEASDNPIFRGKVSVQRLIGDSNDELRVSVVNFSPGAVNVFHTHTFDQVLYVIEGEGIVATEEKEVRVAPGTIIYIPAGEKHWHGAAEDSAFSHIAIMTPGETSF